MIDLKFLKENLQAVKQNIANRYMQADADLTLELYEAKNKALAELEELRKARNENAAKMKKSPAGGMRETLVQEGKNLKDRIAVLEEKTDSLSAQLAEEAAKIPNMAHPQAPLGKDDSSNPEIKRVGTVRQFGFKPLDHVELGERLGLIDFEAGAKVTGPKFYFLKNEAVLLELALVRFALDLLAQKGFVLYQTPDIARESILEGIGFNPRGPESNIYPLEGAGTCLVGTAEITLGGYYANEIINLDNGPLLMAGVSHCFRREAGSAGQFSKGLYRVHQFTKVEMFVYAKPEESDAMHEKLRAIEEEIFTQLGLPFRVVDTCLGDLGAAAYRKYDLEAWMPGRGENGDYGEVTSTSNCTDYQSRRLNIRFKDKDGKNKYAHTLNGTAVATSRVILALLENGQQEDGSITLPPVLKPYMGFDTIKAKE